MATFSSLTAAQQAQILEFVTVMRTSIATFVSACNQCAEIDNLWQQSISALVASLDAGTSLNDNTGFAGAASVTKESLTSILNSIETFLSTYNNATSRNNYLPIVGIANMVK